VRYRYDEANGCRHKTVELIVETVPWTARGRRARRRDEEMVAVRIGYNETDLRERAKRLGAVWRPAQKLWELSWLDAKRLRLSDRVVDFASVAAAPGPRTCRHKPVSTNAILHLPVDTSSIRSMLDKHS
jgi:hypothetical protein